MDGAFEVLDLRAGAYDVVASLDGYLDAIVPGVLVGGDDLTLPDLLLATADPTCGLGTTLDTDADGAGDSCDTCPAEANPDQRPATLPLQLEPTRALCTPPGSLTYTAASAVLTRGRTASFDPPRAAQGASVA